MLHDGTDGRTGEDDATDGRTKDEDGDDGTDEVQGKHS